MSMKPIQTFITIAIVLLSIGTNVCHAEFFADTVHTVKVYFTSSTFWAALDSTHLTETYMPCNYVVFNNKDTMRNVGIMLKGNSSYGHPGQKKSFHLKFDYTVVQDYRGNERLTFNNCFKDPTFMREKLATEIFHDMGVPCPRSTYAVVYFNDTYWGFYTVVDPINHEALRRVFSEDDGNLYKGDPTGNLSWLGWDFGPYRANYSKESNEDLDDWTDLVAFANFLNNSSDTDFPNIVNWFDVELFARMWAVNTFLVSLDSYQGSGHNYYLYFDYNNIARYIVWDVNESFGVFTCGMSTSALRTMAIDWRRTAPPAANARPLAERMFTDLPAFRPLVDCALHELLETSLDTATFNARVDQLANLIRTYVYADANKMYTNAAFETNLTDDYSGMPGLKDFIADRSIYIASHISACTRTNVDGSVFINEVMPANDTTIADESGDYEDWIELYNPADTSVDISLWWLSDDYNEPRKWFFPRGTTIAPRNFLLVWTDSDPEQGDFHAAFSLDASREKIALFGSDYLGALLCDSTSWRNLSADASMNRCPNGGATWSRSLRATPGTSNDCGSIYVENESALPISVNANVHPNPFNSTCSIDVPEGARIGIFDLDGKCVFRQIAPAKHATSNSAIHIKWTPEKQLVSGVYFVKITTEQANYVLPVMYIK